MYLHADGDHYYDPLRLRSASSYEPVFAARDHQQLHRVPSVNPEGFKMREGLCVGAEGYEYQNERLSATWVVLLGEQRLQQLC